MSHNTWIHRSVRVAVRPLAGTRVTPNQITTARLISGLLSALFFAIGTTSWNRAGAALFVVAMLLDRADGELARATGQKSAWGHRYDLLSDGLSNSLVFVGIGIGLRDSPLGYWAIALGIAAGVAVIAIFNLVVRIEKTGGERAAELKPWGGFDADDAMIFVPVAMLLGAGPALLIATATCTPVVFLSMLWHFRQVHKRPRANRAI